MIGNTYYCYKQKAMKNMHTFTTFSTSSLSLFIVRKAMMPSPATAASADSLEPTDYKKH